MNAAKLPSIRVTPESQAAFMRRGIAAIEATRRDGSGIPAETVIARLEAKLVAAKQRHTLPSRPPLKPARPKNHERSRNPR